MWCAMSGETAPEVGLILKIPVADAELFALLQSSGMTLQELEGNITKEEDMRLASSILALLEHVRRIQDKDPGVQWNDKKGPFDNGPDECHVITPIKIRDGLWVRVVSDKPNCHY